MRVNSIYRRSSTRTAKGYSPSREYTPTEEVGEDTFIFGAHIFTTDAPDETEFTHHRVTTQKEY